MLDRSMNVAAQVAVAGEAVGTIAANTLSETLASTPVVPGSFTLTGASETYTDNGDGTLTGDVSGTGTIDYITGDVTVASGINEAVTGDYSYFDVANSRDVVFTSGIHPTDLSFRAEGASVAVVVEESDDVSNWNLVFSGDVSAWGYRNLGISTQENLRVLVSGQGRLLGRPVNAV